MNTSMTLEENFLLLKLESAEQHCMNIRTHSKNLDIFPENYLLTQEKQQRGNRSNVGFVSLV